MKLNRKWFLVIALVLSLAMATAGTLAYLTDRDTVENVFTMGNVNIKVEEEYEKDSELVPGIEVTKKAGIRNEHETEDAWVWMIVSVPENLQDYLELKWDEAVFTVEKDAGSPHEGYVGYLAKYTDNTKVLEAGKSTGPILLSVTLKNTVDYQGGKYVSVVDGVITEIGAPDEILKSIYVDGFAMQIDGFDTVDEAIDAYKGQWGDNFKGGKSDPDADTWDGTKDTSWYNDTDTEFVITTAEQLAGFAKLVDDGNTFAGKTIKLGNDINLYAVDENGEKVTFNPIGNNSAQVFEGTFDGQDHTIENLYQNGWDLGYEWGAYGSVSLFSSLNNATVKNLTMSGSETQVEGGDVAGITGSATGTCVFENITIEKSDIATYNNSCAGIIGWSGAGTYTFKNITIKEDVELTGLWGSFDSSIGGIVGQAEPGATYNFENVEINCRLNVFNDCTASYDYYNYRMCGMVMGRLEETITIDGTNYPDTSKYNITCNNVTVNYGDWMNYHYCEPTPGHNNGRGMRVEPGYSYSGLPADYDHSQCTTNHNASMPFDQIFGGAQLGVKGLKSYTGVTVNYPDDYPFED